MRALLRKTTAGCETHPKGETKDTGRAHRALTRPSDHLGLNPCPSPKPQASITYLLLKRGAAPNGSGAAAFAPKSPLEEALAYARNNCQSFNAISDKVNYKDVRSQVRARAHHAGSGFGGESAARRP